MVYNKYNDNYIILDILLLYIIPFMNIFYYMLTYNVISISGVISIFSYLRYNSIITYIYNIDITTS